jgi:hypothetical protein
MVAADHDHPDPVHPAGRIWLSTLFSAIPWKTVSPQAFHDLR